MNGIGLFGCLACKLGSVRYCYGGFVLWNEEFDRGDMSRRGHVCSIKGFLRIGGK